jgi:hypothetical protein
MRRISTTTLRSKSREASGNTRKCRGGGKQRGMTLKKAGSRAHPLLVNRNLSLSLMKPNLTLIRSERGARAKRMVFNKKGRGLTLLKTHPNHQLLL